MKVTLISSYGISMRMLLTGAFFLGLITLSCSGFISSWSQGLITQVMVALTAVCLCVPGIVHWVNMKEFRTHPGLKHFNETAANLCSASSIVICLLAIGTCMVGSGWDVRPWTIVIPSVAVLLVVFFVSYENTRLFSVDNMHLVIVSGTTYYPGEKFYLRSFHDYQIESLPRTLAVSVVFRDGFVTDARSSSVKRTVPALVRASVTLDLIAMSSAGPRLSSVVSWRHEIAKAIGKGIGMFAHDNVSPMLENDSEGGPLIQTQSKTFEVPGCSGAVHMKYTPVISFDANLDPDTLESDATFKATGGDGRGVEEEGDATVRAATAA